MGQRPGYLYTRFKGQKISGEEELPDEFLNYARRHFSSYLEAPKSWTGKYVDVMSVFMSERSPVAAVSP